LFRIILLVVFFFCSIINSQTNRAAISGKITNAKNFSPLINANVSIHSTNNKDKILTGTVSDSLGRYKLILPYGSYSIKVSYIGFESYEGTFSLNEKNKNVEINIELKPSVFREEEITVTAERESPSTISQEIENKDLVRMPTLYNDVLRAVQILPGVSTSSELTSGYNVRGGSFDDNLIYLNGYEIYRPFLLRQGIEENKTIINPDLVEEFRLYNGSFPASYGDKMSSALEVNYKLNDTSGGLIKVDLLNAGLTLRNKIGSTNIAGAVRYAYPGLFLNELQTSGDYKPRYRDVQLFANHQLNENEQLELLLLYADNKFDLTPENWKGNFGGFSRGDIRAIDIFYDGNRNYSFITGLAGLKYTSLINENTQLKISAARYSTIEEESSNLFSEYFYRENADDETHREFIKDSQEFVDNKLDLVSYEFIPELKLKKDNHFFTAGLNFRFTDVYNRINENFNESSDTLISDLPSDRNINENFTLNSFSGFIQDEFTINHNLFFNAGIRTTYYSSNEELFFSPRLSFIYIPAERHCLTLSWGYYYQPPYYNELRNKTKEEGKKLKAQKSIHYSAGWEYQFKEKVKMNIELYYKDLDHLIPYYIDREKTEYANHNNNTGYAYGFDLMFQGEIVKDLNSWIGYGYLNTKEKNKLTGEAYRRRLTDQTHTLQVFLQDKIKKHPNWQMHSRLLFGSGHLYNLRKIVTDEPTGRNFLVVTPDQVEEFFIYFRIDMGLSAGFDIDESKNLVVVAEVFNIFNHYNYGGYRFVQVAASTPSGGVIPRVFHIPQVLSKRFFNLSLELRF